MAALIVGGIALGVDKIKAHRAKGKEKAAAARVATLTEDTTTDSSSSTQKPGFPPHRPTLDKRGRKGYTEFHTATLASTGQSSPDGDENSSSASANVHPAERGALAHGASYQTQTSQDDDHATGSGEFVDDEKERLRRFYEERDRADGHGMRGRTSQDLRRALPAYGRSRSESAERRRETEDEAGAEPAGPPPSYEFANATARR